MIVVEILCDNRNESNPNCDSHRSGETHGEGNTNRSVVDATNFMRSAVLSSGWVKHKSNLYCESCAQHLGVSTT